GYMFEAALEAGFVAAGANVRMLGPMPTPAVAMLTRSLRADAGIVISASHNPHEDNGIKFFSAQGEKLADDVEAAIEEELERPFDASRSDRRACEGNRRRPRHRLRRRRRPRADGRRQWPPARRRRADLAAGPGLARERPLARSRGRHADEQFRARARARPVR